MYGVGIAIKGNMIFYFLSILPMLSTYQTNLSILKRKKRNNIIMKEYNYLLFLAKFPVNCVLIPIKLNC